ncbi:MAG: ATP-binding cassette domain-containing protein [Coriobacteriales bacterium]|nr:ATP-binding cassette domain-containing protein [Coriobacteriales bacterium]
MNEKSFVVCNELCNHLPTGKVFTNVSFTAQKGQVVALFGSQGSGKTALLLSISGRMHTSSGSALVNNYNLRTQAGNIRKISALSIIKGLNDVQPFLKVRKLISAELTLNGKKSSKKHVQNFLKEYDFEQFANTKNSQLDAYNKCIFGIILAMCAQPQLLCVDDIQSDLTQYESKKIVAFLRQIAKKNNTCVLVTSSEYEIATQANALILLDQKSANQRLAMLKENTRFEHAEVVGYGNDAREVLCND